MTANCFLGRSILIEAPRSKSRSCLTLIVGIVVGYSLAQLISYIDTAQYIDPYMVKKSNDPGNLQKVELFDDLQDDNTTLADQLHKEVRLLCWIMTNPTNHKKKARHVKRTWGKRCNILLFMSSGADDELPTVKLPVEEGRGNLWAKVKLAFQYVYEHHYNDADWFLKADDDTYTIVENMRYMLYPYNPETPIYFGHKFKTYITQGYMSGGAGYVLSREALRRFVVEGIPNPDMCLPGTVENEDIEVGRCLERLNVTAGDSRDMINGRGRMFPFTPDYHLVPDRNYTDFWYWKFIYYKTDEGLDCCSNLTISFHYVSPNQLYMFDFLIYQLRPYGVVPITKRLPAKLKLGEFLAAPNETQNASNEDSKDDEDKMVWTTRQTNLEEPDAREVDSEEVESEET